MSTAPRVSGPKRRVNPCAPTPPRVSGPKRCVKPCTTPLRGATRAVPPASSPQVCARRRRGPAGAVRGSAAPGHTEPAGEVPTAPPLRGECQRRMLGPSSAPHLWERAPPDRPSALPPAPRGDGSAGPLAPQQSSGGLLGGMGDRTGAPVPD